MPTTDGLASLDHAPRRSCRSLRGCNSQRRARARRFGLRRPPDRSGANAAIEPRSAYPVRGSDLGPPGDPTPAHHRLGSAAPITVIVSCRLSLEVGDYASPWQKPRNCSPEAFGRTAAELLSKEVDFAVLTRSGVDIRKSQAYLPRPSRTIGFVNQNEP